VQAVEPDVARAIAIETLAVQLEAHDVVLVLDVMRAIANVAIGFDVELR
jgi:hypothetical protein